MSIHYLKSVYDADLEKIDRYTPASNNPEIVKEVSEMPGMIPLTKEKKKEKRSNYMFH
jgi:hypothetical protein